MGSFHGGVQRREAAPGHIGQSQLKPRCLATRPELQYKSTTLAALLTVSTIDSPVKRGDIIWLKFSKLPYPKRISV